MHFISPRRLALAALCLWGTGLVGCGKTSPEQSAKQPAQEAERIPAPRASRGREEKSEPLPTSKDRLHQSFLDATRAYPPADERPPEKTMTGKSVGRLYEQVVRTWDSIRFRTEDGRKIRWTATIQTELGAIEIALDPERAPNHVRNFIALARVGYYDGLCFDRIHHEETNLATGTRYEEIEAGCPLGTGEPLSGSIGYWLKPEFNDATHEAGTIGACRGVEEDTAACKFYISLCRAPYLDSHCTVFAKVTKGLEVARKIFLQPVVLEDSDVNGSRRPLKPVVIQKVTVHEEVEK
jgi:cyclophilin family peptidyl-prolyl cis-trans isomerase